MKFKPIKILAILLSIPFAAVADDYIIKKGDHYSNVTDLPSYYTGKSMKFKAMFDESAIYDLGNENQYDVNKLYGTSDCGSWSPTQNSARFGWVWNLQTKKLEIYGFVHVNGKFDFTLIDHADLNQVFDYELTLSEDGSQYIFNFRGKTISMNRGCSKSEMSGFKLKPYFGGNEVAPHDVLIKIEDSSDYATLSIQNVYPNPVIGQNISLDLNLPESLNVGFRIYDLNGRLVTQIEPTELPASAALINHKINLGNLSGGVYLIRPYAIVSGSEKYGFVNGEGRATKFVVP